MFPQYLSRGETLPGDGAPLSSLSDHTKQKLSDLNGNCHPSLLTHPLLSEGLSEEVVWRQIGQWGEDDDWGMQLPKALRRTMLCSPGEAVYLGPLRVQPTLLARLTDTLVRLAPWEQNSPGCLCQRLGTAPLSPDHLALTSWEVSAKPVASLAVCVKSGRLLLRPLVPVAAFPHEGLWLVHGGSMGSPPGPPKVRGQVLLQADGHCIQALHQVPSGLQDPYILSSSRPFGQCRRSE